MRSFLNIFLILSFCSFFLICCKKVNPTNNNPTNNNPTNNNSTNNNSQCDFTVFNSNFSKINKNSTYDSVKLIFGIDGDNFRNDGVGTSQIKFYRWYTCADKFYCVDCWFKNGSLELATKTFKNEICSNNITSNSFSSLSNGMTYEQVCVLLDSKGDNFRNDYTPTNQTNFYRYYNCSDKLKYIEVWFENNSASLITKNL
jgi:hypothetical protein